MNKNNQLDGLTIFRFVAAFYVFIFHAYLQFRITFTPIIESFVRNGAVGMTFFFVLSGFVLAWSSRFGIKENYYTSRLLRIYPAYLLMGLITLPMLNLENIHTALSQLLIFLLASQSWFPNSFFHWNFIGSWSVSTELFFYISFPFIFTMIRKKPFLFAIISYALSSMIFIMSQNLGVKTPIPDIYVGPVFRLPEFAFGVSLGCIYSKGIRPGLLKIPLLALAAYLMVFTSPPGNTAWMANNAFTLIATGILIYVLASINVRKTLLTLPLIYLGKISYSFYLMQIPLVMLIIKYHSYFDGIEKWKLWFGMFIINTLLASLSFHFVENINYRKVFSFSRKPENP